MATMQPPQKPADRHSIVCPRCKKVVGQRRPGYMAFGGIIIDFAFTGKCRHCGFERVEVEPLPYDLS